MEERGSGNSSAKVCSEHYSNSVLVLRSAPLRSLVSTPERCFNVDPCSLC